MSFIAIIRYGGPRGSFGANGPNIILFWEQHALPNRNKQPKQLGFTLYEVSISKEAVQSLSQIFRKCGFEGGAWSLVGH